MQPARLDDQALRFELRIRKVVFNDIKGSGYNQRILRSYLRDEMKDPTLRPKPEHDANDEITEISAYVNDLIEQTTISRFKKGEKIYEDVYAQLCHVEGRVAYVKWQEHEDEATRKMYEAVNKRMEEFRKKYYSERPLFIIENARVFNDNEDAVVFDQENAKKLKELEDQVEALKLQKAKATQQDISYEIELETTDSEDEKDREEERVRQTKDLARRKEMFEEMKRRRIEGSSSQQRNTSEHGNTPQIPIVSTQQPHPRDQIPNPNQETYTNYQGGDGNFHANGGMNSTQRSFSSHRPNTLPMYKWKISFDGNSDGEVIAFIKDVENMAKAQGTTPEELRGGIYILLKDKAKDWYRVFGHQCGPWGDFVERFKEVYLPADFNHRVDDEIRRTIQKESETFQDFCVRIEMVFMKLSYEMREDRKLDHMKHNMHHSYKTPDVAKIKTVNELREACHFVDSISDRFRAFKTNQKNEKPANMRPTNRVFAVETEDPSNNDTDEGEIPSSANSMCQERNEIADIQAATREYRLSRQHQATRNFANVKCYNCNQMGHFSSSCPRPRKVPTCSGCGVRGTSRQNCNKCAERDRSRQNRNQKGNTQSAGNQSSPQ